VTRSARVLQVLSCILIAAGSVTCSGDKLVLPDEGDPAAITVVSGNNQNGTVGLVVTDSVVVRVTDSKARPVVDARVQFNLGTNGTGGDLIPDTAVTDADGRARARWVLGTKGGGPAGHCPGRRFQQGVHQLQRYRSGRCRRHRFRPQR
jgi:hypothetical protein